MNKPRKEKKLLCFRVIIILLALFFLVIFSNYIVGKIEHEINNPFVSESLPNTDYVHIICYGQSLSNGSDSLFISDDLVKGCYTLGTIDMPTASLTDLVLTSGQQHPIVSAVNSLATLAHEYCNNSSFIVGSYGIGGQSIVQLMSAARQAEIKTECGYSYDISTGNRYEVFLNSLSCGKQIADKENRTISCPAIVFLQGERDYYTDESLSNREGHTINAYACGGDKEKYKLYMTRLKEDMQNAVMEEYGQADKPLFCIYQVSGTYIKNHEMTINMAQIEFAKENEDVILLPAPYFVPNYNSGHLSTNGYRWYGEYIAKAIFQTLVLDSEFKPLMKDNCIIDGYKIRVKVCNAILPLSIDTYTVEQSKDYGFAVWADSTEVVIDNIELFGDEIIITTLTDLENSSSVEISYAGMERGGTGNIRDNSADKALYEYWNDTADKGTSGNLTISHRPTDENGTLIVGKKYPMWNWLASFYEKLK